MKGKKTGGRKGGTPNKVTRKTREVIAEAADGYFSSARFAEDLESLQPRDRLLVMERLAAYVAPRMQATTVEAGPATRGAIEDALLKLSGDGG